MPVRGSTEWQHARVMKKVINLDRGDHIHCAFWDCEREGYDMYRRTHHEHLRMWEINGKRVTGDRLCEAIDAGIVPGIHRHYIYCSERHRNMDFFGMGPQGVAMAERNGGGMYGYLPTGYHGSHL